MKCWICADQLLKDKINLFSEFLNSIFIKDFLSAYFIELSIILTNICCNWSESPKIFTGFDLVYLIFIPFFLALVSVRLIESRIILLRFTTFVIFFVKNIDDFDLKKIGPEIENNNLFPEKCNVTLANVINENLIRIKVWERGAGLTKACGTAACAAAYAGKINGLVKSKTDIEFELGKLSIFIDDKDSIHMKGLVSDIKNLEIKI